MSIKDNFLKFKSSIDSSIHLVAVSKTKPNENILELYNCGQRDFGENYVQELVDKSEVLPKDIHWHFIGHLQSNKVKYIAPFVHLIHGVDSLKLLKEIQKQAVKNNRKIDCMLQVYIAKEETKFGLSEEEVLQLINKINTDEYDHIHVVGLMGMASNTDDENRIRNEFRSLSDLFSKIGEEKIGNVEMKFLSMGMSGDYEIAVEEGSNMLRIGSLLFGERN